MVDAEPAGLLAEHPSVIVYVIATSVMIFSAGVASFPPARDFKGFAAASILYIIWILVLYVDEELAIAAHALFALDVVCIILFYRISIPGPESDKSLPVLSFRRDWATYLCGVYGCMIILQIVRVVIDYEFPLRGAVSSLLILLAFVAAWIFNRAYRLRALIIYVLIILFFLALTYIAFLPTIYYLTLGAYIIVIAHSAEGAIKNIRQWVRL